MRLLLDTDVFVKLGAARLLSPAVEIFDCDFSDCYRLPALPHMLARGRLRRMLGGVAADELIKLSNKLRVAPSPPSVWLDLLVDLPGVDPGEAQLLAAIPESDATVMTGDKRALVAISGVTEFVRALEGRVVLLEAVLYELCVILGDDAVQVAIRGAAISDHMLRVCFGSVEASPREALQSYFMDAEKLVHPLCLWKPTSREGG